VSGISRIDKFVRELLNEDSLAEANVKREIDVTLVVGNVDTYKQKVLALSAVALLVRCFTGKISILFECTDNNHNNALFKLLVYEAQKTGSGARIEGTHHVGGLTMGLATAIICSVNVDAVGWVAGINKNFDKNLSAVAPAAIFSVSCGVAKLFWASLSGSDKHIKEEYSISLLDFTLNPVTPDEFIRPQIDFGQIVLVGAGAIGAAFSFALYHSEWKARLHIIDRDRYESQNIETTMHIDVNDANKNRPKAIALSEKMCSDFIYATGEKSEITSNKCEIKGNYRYLISAVDNSETRRALRQSAETTLIINGGVGGSKEDAGHVLVSRHGGHDQSISALYKSDRLKTETNLPPPIEIADECSRVAYNNIAMAAPFLGVACGALLVALCCQNNAGNVANTNYLKIDILRLQSKMLTYQLS
jgi:hypothetical protein